MSVRGGDQHVIPLSSVSSGPCDVTEDISDSLSMVSKTIHDDMSKRDLLRSRASDGSADSHISSSNPRPQHDDKIHGTEREEDGHVQPFVDRPDQVRKRREFANRQKIRRQIYREITSFQLFPLQEMAMKDLDEKMNDYLTSSSAAGSDPQQGVASQSSETSLATLQARNNESASDVLRSEFLEEFLREKSIRIPTAKVMITLPEGNQTGQDNLSHLSLDGKLNTVSSHVDQKETNDQTSAKKSTTSSTATDHTQQFLPCLWSMEPRIFAMETPIKGKRRYIVGHLGRFMDHYWRECDGHNRHFYELIREETPCRLYFDLEYCKHSNGKLTPAITETILTQLFEEIKLQFKLTYNIEINRSCMIDLDSSTPKKMSRHWIFHLPDGELFRDAKTAGTFVKSLVGRLEAEHDSGELKSRGHGLLAENLFVNATSSKTDTTKLTRFIDLGVYTRNRLFRIMGSTKFGKPADAALRIAKANEFPFPNGFGNHKFYLPKMAKMSSNLSDACEDELSHLDFGYENFCNSLSWEDHAKALATTLVVPPNVRKICYPILKDPDELDTKGQTTLFEVNGKLTTQSSSSSLSFATSRPKSLRISSNYGQSPFPKLEKFIMEKLATRKGLQGNIGTWCLGTQHPLPSTIAFNMLNNRWCEHIGREHKSNNIIWVVHLRDKICWQSCHDPECRADGFRGEVRDLPDEVNLEIDDYFLDFELSSLNESLIVKEANESKLGEVLDEDEFEDHALEQALLQLNISDIVQSNNDGQITSDAEFDDVALDDQLAKIDISEVCSHRPERRRPFADITNQKKSLGREHEEISKPLRHNSSSAPQLSPKHRGHDEGSNGKPSSDASPAAIGEWDDVPDSELLELASVLPDVFS